MSLALGVVETFMCANSELDRDVANYRALRPAHQTLVRAAAVRRANALRLAAFREVFWALARTLRRLGGAIGRRGKGASPR
jgi:hypothetical protein